MFNKLQDYLIYNKTRAESACELHVQHFIWFKSADCKVINVVGVKKTHSLLQSAVVTKAPSLSTSHFPQNAVGFL